MEIILGIFLVILFSFNFVSLPSSWKRSFPEPEDSYGEVTTRARFNQEFADFAINLTARASGALCVVTIIAAYFSYRLTPLSGKIFSIVLGIMELANLAVLKQEVALIVKRPGELKPLWLLYFQRVRDSIILISIAAIVLVLVFV